MNNDYDPNLKGYDAIQVSRVSKMSELGAAVEIKDASKGEMSYSMDKPIYMAMDRFSYTLKMDSGNL